eukprot:COSAG05_NODE_1236_length_5437_cov_15.230611_8_plen_87_part_00
MCTEAHLQVLNIRPAEDDVLVHLVRWQNGVVLFPGLRAERPHILQCHCRVLRVDGEQRALVANLGLTDQAYPRTFVGYLARHLLWQ